MTRISRTAVEQMMAQRPDATLEVLLEVFEVFASGSLTDEVYVLDDVGGKRIAIAPTALKEKYRRGGGRPPPATSRPMGAGGPRNRQGPRPAPGGRDRDRERRPATARRDRAAAATPC